VKRDKSIDEEIFLAALFLCFLLALEVSLKGPWTLRNGSFLLLVSLLPAPRPMEVGFIIPKMRSY